MSMILGTGQPSAREVRWIWLLILLIILIANRAFGQESYTKQLGEPLASWQADNKTDRCSKPGQSGWGDLEPGTGVCVWVFTGKDAKSFQTASLFRRTAYFYEGKLYRVSLEFNRSSAAPVLAGLTTALGTPALTKTTTYQNGLGMSFDRASAGWTDGVNSTVFNEFDYDLETSVVHVFSVSVQKHQRPLKAVSAIAAQYLVVAKDDSGDDSGLRVGVHVELLGYDRVVV